ncbi:hypothetical protein BT63DRAFT_416198 [Microthyrium microscopicum]|uniref:Uncharacterized protein n=1 Tax=Microthyrium microscopicum TaxID=703497 RepID=A0A6A6U7R4_9PEZI|nr:hypothetical protein BT63DRAFT_416198 [Microthyrium microscopicum]
MRACQPCKWRELTTSCCCKVGATSHLESLWTGSAVLSKSMLPATRAQEVFMTTAGVHNTEEMGVMKLKKTKSRKDIRKRTKPYNKPLPSAEEIPYSRIVAIHADASTTLLASWLQQRAEMSGNDCTRSGDGTVAIRSMMNLCTLETELN